MKPTTCLLAVLALLPPAVALAQAPAAADPAAELFRDNVVIVLDASGSMNEKIRGTDVTRMEAAKSALPAFKQYREADGKFYFKLVAADGRLLLQSTGFDAPKEAGQAIARLQKEADALQALAGQLAPVQGVATAEVAAALQALAEAAAAA